MSQLVFLHGPGAGACADAYYHQSRHFPDSVAPNLPGHLEGSRCPDVARYAEWVRGWLWARSLNKDLVLVGYTLGASIALQYGLDYPDEVKGLVVMTVAPRPKVRPPGTYEMRLHAAEDPKVYEEWLAYQRKAMYLAQVPKTPGVHLVGIADLAPANARHAVVHPHPHRAGTVFVNGSREPGHWREADEVAASKPVQTVQLIAHQQVA